MTSRFCTLTSKFFSLEFVTSWKFRPIENPGPDLNPVNNYAVRDVIQGLLVYRVLTLYCRAYICAVCVSTSNRICLTIYGVINFNDISSALSSYVYGIHVTFTGV